MGIKTIEDWEGWTTLSGSREHKNCMRYLMANISSPPTKREYRRSPANKTNKRFSSIENEFHWKNSCFSFAHSFILFFGAIIMNRKSTFGATLFKCFFHSWKKNLYKLPSDGMAKRNCYGHGVGALFCWLFHWQKLLWIHYDICPFVVTPPM